MFSLAEAIEKSVGAIIEQCWPVRSTKADAEIIKKLIDAVSELKQCIEDIHSTKLLKEKLKFSSEEEEFCLLFPAKLSENYSPLRAYSLKLGQILSAKQNLRENFFKACGFAKEANELLGQLRDKTLPEVLNFVNDIKPSVALTSLAFCYYFGLGVEASAKTAIELWQAAALLGSRVARNNLAVIKALDWEQHPKAAKEGVEDIWALSRSEPFCPHFPFNCARALGLGIGGPKDVKSSLDLMQRVSDRGYAPAEVDLGASLERLEPAKTKSLYLSAALRGYAVAQCNVGAR